MAALKVAGRSGDKSGGQARSSIDQYLDFLQWHDAIRALTGEPRARLTSIICRRRRQHELRRALGAQHRSGHTLPA